MYRQTSTFVLQINIVVIPAIYVVTDMYVCITKYFVVLPNIHIITSMYVCFTNQYVCITGHSCINGHSRLYHNSICSSPVYYVLTHIYVCIAKQYVFISCQLCITIHLRLYCKTICVHYRSVMYYHPFTFALQNKMCVVPACYACIHVCITNQ